MFKNLENNQLYLKFVVAWGPYSNVFYLVCIIYIQVVQSNSCNKYLHVMWVRIIVKLVHNIKR